MIVPVNGSEKKETKTPISDAMTARSVCHCAPSSTVTLQQANNDAKSVIKPNVKPFFRQRFSEREAGA